MSEILKIRLAARCEAAGRPENEDNFQVAEDLSVSNVGFETDKIFPLGNKGTLLLVCDGMGGMNAGEVASAIGVETIKNLFAPQLLTSEVLANDESICAYMKRAIIKADSRIKEEAQKDSAKQGMGSTAVMAWLLGQKVYVAWCGDSRCYRYNSAMGLEQLSHDHSYVQDLVDTDQLKPELAFDHPNKNIITRSLGDPRGAARPDTKVFNLHVGDVILLCSDGLNDSLRDSEIAQSISRSLDSMGSCRDALWNDSKQAGWHDNVTIVLAQVVDENAAYDSCQASTHSPSTNPTEPIQPQVTQAQVTSTTPTSHVTPPVRQSPTKSASGASRKVIISVVVALLIVAIALLLWKFLGNPTSRHEDSNGKDKYVEYYQQIEKIEPDYFVKCRPEDVCKEIQSYVEIYNNMYNLKSDGDSTKNAKQKLENAINNTVELFKLDTSKNDLVKPIKSIKEEIQ